MSRTTQHALVRNQLEMYFLAKGFSRMRTIYRELFLKKGSIVVFFSKCAYRVQRVDATRAFTQASLEAMAKKSSKIAGTYFKNVVFENGELQGLPKEVTDAFKDV
jgi:hypothetical protein